MRLTDFLVGLFALGIYAAYHSGIFLLLACILLAALSGGFNLIGQFL